MSIVSKVKSAAIPLVGIGMLAGSILGFTNALAESVKYKPVTEKAERLQNNGNRREYENFMSNPNNLEILKESSYANSKMLFSFVGGTGGLFICMYSFAKRLDDVTEGSY